MKKYFNCKKHCYKKCFMFESALKMHFCMQSFKIIYQKKKFFSIMLRLVNWVSQTEFLEIKRQIFFWNFCHFPANRTLAVIENKFFSLSLLVSSSRYRSFRISSIPSLQYLRLCAIWNQFLPTTYFMSSIFSVAFLYFFLFFCFFRTPLYHPIRLFFVVLPGISATFLIKSVRPVGF